MLTPKQSKQTNRPLKRKKKKKKKKKKEEEVNGIV
jgi:hypothetical protein